MQRKSVDIVPTHLRIKHIYIVGEIANGRTDDLTQEASPEIYLSLWQANAFSKHLVVRTTADPRGGGCGGTRTALRRSDGGYRKRKDAGADSR